jgi:D-3-phosphoglycerate dehydrogenase
MKPFILVCDGLDKVLFDQLCANPNLTVHPKSKLTLDELRPLLSKANALVVRSATQVNPELLALAPNLKYVVRAGEGTDNIDKKACAERGVKVANTPGANNNSAAEHTIALMFTLLRKTAWAHQSMTKGEWNKAAFEGNELWKKTIGIIGFGRIGQIIATRLSGFEPSVLYYDPLVKDGKFPSYVTKVEDLDTIFKKSDIITVHVPLVEATKNLITAKQLQMMKPSAILLNVARGKIINEEDLTKVLTEKRIRGAALDVFSTEPLPADSKLRSLANMVLTPHLGASTEEAQFRVGEMCVHQISEFFEHNKLLNEVKA